jgi:hypothetical protein
VGDAVAAARHDHVDANITSGAAPPAPARVGASLIPY